MTAEPVSKVKRKFPPCRSACPAHVNVQAYVSLIQRGRYQEAVDVIRNDMPFPAICGRVCFSPCESECSRKDADQSVAIKALKKFVADIEREQGKAKLSSLPKRHTDRVAVIGAGPAGLTAAYELTKLGYPVTVFERMDEAGGMMRYCIPDFRLGKEVVENEADYIKSLGVEIKTNVEFGKDVTVESLRQEGFKAVFLAIGAQAGMKLNVPGEDLKGVVNAVDFLRRIALGEKVQVGKKVAVVGGGNSAIDAARTAKKIGAQEVVLIYRRSREEMPALPSEVAEAEKEGIKIEILVAPTKILGKDNRVVAVECLRMKLGEPDESGRRRPVPVEGSEHSYEVDMVIPALGQLTESWCVPKALQDEKARVPTVWTDPLTLETKLPGVFAGGDVATGPSSIIEAVAQGKRAAESINLFLSGADVRAGREENIEKTTWTKDSTQIIKKARRYNPDTEKVYATLSEMRDSLKRDEKDAKFESYRCLGCGPCAECLGSTDLCEGDKAAVDETQCIGCNVCVVICPFGAASKDENNIARISEDICKGCGLCATRCPVRAITMKKLTNDHIMQLAMASSGGR